MCPPRQRAVVTRMTVVANFATNFSQRVRVVSRSCPSTSHFSCSLIQEPGPKRWHDMPTRHLIAPFERPFVFELRSMLPTSVWVVSVTRHGGRALPSWLSLSIRAGLLFGSPFGATRGRYSVDVEFAAPESADDITKLQLSNNSISGNFSAVSNKTGSQRTASAAAVRPACPATLQPVDLSENANSGTLERFWLDCMAIVSLGLSNNKLSRSPNAALMLLPFLQFLALSSNSFSGQLGLPASNHASSPLQMLLFSSNQLSGTLLDCIAQLSCLSALAKDSNTLSVTISSSLELNQPLGTHSLLVQPCWSSCAVSRVGQECTIVLCS